MQLATKSVRVLLLPSEDSMALSEAKRLYNFASQYRRKGYHWAFDGESERFRIRTSNIAWQTRVFLFAVNSTYVYLGCARISWRDIDRLAKKLKWKK